jgi:hypothetical protein
MDRMKRKKIAFAAIALVVATGGGWQLSNLLAGKPLCASHCHGQEQRDELPAPSARKVPAAPPSELDKRDTSTVALVGKERIRRWVLDNAIHDRRAAGDTTAELERATLANLVNVELLYQEATRLGFKLGPEAGSLRVDIIRRTYKDTAAFNAQLSKSGMTQDEYVEQWRRQATIEQFVTDSLKNRLKIDDKVLRKLYDRLKRESRQPVTASFEQSLPSLRKSYEEEKVRLMVDSVSRSLRHKQPVRVL